MIICAHPDCGYTVGWTHRGSEHNKRIEPPEGEFYGFRADFSKVEGERFHGNKNEVALYGCPKCRRTFIADGETYLADGETYSE